MAPENPYVITRRSQHPVIRGMVCGAVSVVVTAFLIGFIPPAYAFSVPIGDLFVINLGDLPPWIGVAVAFGVWWDARKAKKNAADAAASAALGRTEIKAVAVQIDGLLAQRDAAKVAEGKLKEKIAGEETAKTLAQGQEEGRKIERESVAASAAQTGVSLGAPAQQPVPVVDETVTAAIRETAAAVTKSAVAVQHVADAARDKDKDKQEN